MPIRSHIDTWMFCKFINIDEEDIADTITSAPDRKDRNAMKNAFQEQHSKSKSLLFHETYHFWQGVRLPYFHRYAVQSLYGVLQGFNDFAKSGVDLFALKGAINPEVDDLLTLYKVLTLEGDIVILKPKKIHIESASNSNQTLWVGEFSPMTLLESATSIAQYQFECNSLSEVFDEVKFGRWLKRHPAESSVYKFVCGYFNDSGSFVLRFLIPLINAAFHTTEPIRAFFTLLAKLNFGTQNLEAAKDFINDPEPCNWHLLFESMLANLHFDKNPDNWHITNFSKLFYRLNIEDLVGEYQMPIPTDIYSGKLPFHPILTPILKVWLEWEKSVPKNYHSILDCPFLNKESYDKWQKLDTMTIMKFNLKSTPFVTISFPNKEIFELFNLPIIHWFFTMTGVIRKATGINFDDDHHLCHHAECSYFSHNYCNSYLKIPEDYKDCKFPSDIAEYVQEFQKAVL